MSELKFMHQVKNASLKNGKRVVHEEGIYLGSKGLTIKFYHKEGNDEYRLVAIRQDDGNYIVRTLKNGEKDERTVSEKQLLKDLQEDDRMAFAVDFLKNPKNMSRLRRSMSGGARRRRSRSRNNSRTGSRRGSSRRGSRASSRRGSRTGSRRRRRSRKNSRN